MPCNPKVVGSVKACYDASIGASNNFDYPIPDSPEISHNAFDPWGLRLTGPSPDGRGYILSFNWYNATVGPASEFKATDTRKWIARAMVATDPEGLHAQMYDGQVIQYTRVYTDTAYNASGYSYLSPFIGHVALGNLKPATTYFYRVRMINAEGKSVSSASELRNFTTLPIKPTYPLKIAITGDIGQTDNSSITRNHVIAHKPQIVLQVGDNSYAGEDLAS